MDQKDDALMRLFVEDTREHLAALESALSAMERGQAEANGEPVNNIFRVTHTIKSAAGFLNLKNIHELAQKLEGVLHMVRTGDVAPDARTIPLLRSWFDRLRLLVEAADSSDAENLSAMFDELTALTDAHLSGEQRAQAAAVIPIGLPGGEPLFTEDELSLRQALDGGKHLYLVEYDLIHDVHARNKTPFDIIHTMEASGLIVDCRMELSAVGDLDAPPVNRIPFYVLFASIVEPDIVGYLFALDGSHIHPVEIAAARPATPAPTEPGSPDAPATPDAANAAGAPAEAPQPEPPDVASPAPEPSWPETSTPSDAGTETAFGPWRLAITGQGALLQLAPGQTPDPEQARLALLAALSHGLGVTMVWNDSPAIDLAMVQVVISAARTFAVRGLPLLHRDGPPCALSETALQAGLAPEALAAVGLPPTVLFAS